MGSLVLFGTLIGYAQRGFLWPTYRAKLGDIFLISAVSGVSNQFADDGDGLFMKYEAFLKDDDENENVSDKVDPGIDGDC